MKKKKLPQAIIKQIKCPACESTQTYINQDGTRVCRRCGKRSQIKGE